MIKYLVIAILCLGLQKECENFSGSVVKFEILKDEYFKKSGPLSGLNELIKNENLIIFFDDRYGEQSLGLLDSDSDSLLFLLFMCDSLQNIDCSYDFKLTNRSEFKLERMDKKNISVATNNEFNHFIEIDKKKKKIVFSYEIESKRKIEIAKIWWK